MKKQNDKPFNPRVLTWLRKRQKLSQVKLATMIDVTKDAVSCWERSVYDCKQAQIDKLAAVFDVPRDVFYMTDSEFAIKHLQMFPADFPNMTQNLVDGFYEYIDQKEYTKAAQIYREIKDEFKFAVAMMSSEPSAAQLRDLETVAKATKDNEDIVKDKDADPRK